MELKKPQVQSCGFYYFTLHPAIDPIKQMLPGCAGLTSKSTQRKSRPKTVEVIFMSLPAGIKILSLFVCLSV